jgi:3-hydroxyacyl-[acyl-carrier-protein] dehydratase
MTERPVTGTSPIPIDIMRIMELIPHRFPFLMVDRIVELVLDEKAVGLKNVSINEPYFQGHFPREAVMPGVLIIESMAQTAAVEPPPASWSTS